MIIWIDGAVGVGKSSVAKELARFLTCKNVSSIDSDLYWYQFLQKSVQETPLKLFSGVYPYNNYYFLAYFRKELEALCNFGTDPIVAMTLADKKSQTELLDYFEKNSVPEIHIILDAPEDIITSRIEGDPCRDECAKSTQKADMSWQIKVLKTLYPTAPKINTLNKSINDIVNEICALPLFCKMID